MTAHDAPADAWTLEALTGDLYQDLAPVVARRGLRCVLYHEGTAVLTSVQATRAKGVLIQALSSTMASVPAGTDLRVDITCLPSLDGGRWLQAHATAAASTVLWLAVPVEG